MRIPFKYTFKNFGARKLTTGITISGITLVVFVFAVVLMMAEGVQKTMRDTGLDENVIVLRKSATGEVSSIIDGETQSIIRNFPEIKKDSEGEPIFSAEPVVIINLQMKTGGMSNITVRGIASQALKLRPQIKIIQGRMINFGLKELMVGKSINERFNGAQLGSIIEFAGDKWKIVGVYESGGNGFESELWGDSRQLLSSFNRGNTVSTVTFKMNSKSDFSAIKTRFLKDRRLNQFEPKIETVFYEEQSQGLAAFIRYLGIFITVVFSMGATIGAAITMYSAVANRTVEIGTLRSLGFSRISILIAFLIESVMISLSGALIGLTLASVMQFYSIATINFATFSELSFKFSFTAGIAITSIIFALVMGVIGGFLPAFRASRLNIVKALRG